MSIRRGLDLRLALKRTAETIIVLKFEANKLILFFSVMIFQIFFRADAFRAVDPDSVMIFQIFFRTSSFNSVDRACQPCLGGKCNLVSEKEVLN